MRHHRRAGKRDRRVHDLSRAKHDQDMRSRGHSQPIDLAGQRPTRPEVQDVREWEPVRNRSIIWSDEIAIRRVAFVQGQWFSDEDQQDEWNTQSRKSRAQIPPRETLMRPRWEPQRESLNTNSAPGGNGQQRGPTHRKDATTEREAIHSGRASKAIGIG